jgi:hypothetical protein
MSPTDYQYYPLQQGGMYQTAFEDISENAAKTVSNLNDVNDIFDKIMSGIMVDAIQLQEPGLEQAIPPILISTGFVMDNLSTILVNVTTVFTQLMDPSNYVDPEYGN